MRRTLAGLITTIVMGLMTWTALSQSRSSRDAPRGTQTNSTFQNSRLQDRADLQGATACIEGLLAGARAGDVTSYLTAFGEPLRARLAREADEIGRDVFALRLRRADLARKSHAIFAPEPEGDRPDSARITVESSFADRIERQTFRLERANGGWRVTEIETAREHVPKTRLGSLATYEEPEGPPVAVGSDLPRGEEIEN